MQLKGEQVEAAAKTGSGRLVAISLAAMLCAGASLAAAGGAPFETIAESGTIRLVAGKSLVLRAKDDVSRTATVDEGVALPVQLTRREISLIGRGQGKTQITFWFDDPAQPPVTYLVEVTPAANE